MAHLTEASHHSSHYMSNLPPTIFNLASVGNGEAKCGIKYSFRESRELNLLIEQLTFAYSLLLEALEAHKVLNEARLELTVAVLAHSRSKDKFMRDY